MSVEGYLSFRPWFTAWFRICGYGPLVSNGPELFSERYGYRKCFRLFGVRFEWLSPR